MENPPRTEKTPKALTHKFSRAVANNLSVIAASAAQLQLMKAGIIPRSPGQELACSEAMERATNNITGLLQQPGAWNDL